MLKVPLYLVISYRLKTNQLINKITMLGWCGRVMSGPYIGIEQIDAVQALAAVNAAFDTT